MLRSSIFAALVLAGMVGPLHAEDIRQESAIAKAPAPDVNVARGKRAFQRYCVVCHGARGEGGVGPNLQDVTARLGDEAIQRQIQAPRGAMPRFYPSPVDDAALADLLAFLAQLK